MQVETPIRQFADNGRPGWAAMKRHDVEIRQRLATIDYHGLQEVDCIELRRTATIYDVSNDELRRSAMFGND